MSDGDDPFSSPPPAKRMASNDALLRALDNIKGTVQGINERLQNYATKEDVTCIKTEMRAEIKQTADHVKQIEARQETINVGLDARISRVFDKRIADLKSSRTGILSLTHDEMEEKRLFFEARRSVQIWPVPECLDIANGCHGFFHKFLKISLDKTDNIVFEHIERIYQRRRSKIHDQVLIRFKSSRTRDLIQSYALNLANHQGKAGLRLQIPEHLRGLHKMYESHGDRLKKEQGPGLKRSINLDDATQSLVMDVKLSEDDEWLRIYREDMIQTNKDHLDRSSMLRTEKLSVSQSEKIRRCLLRSPVKTAPNYIDVESDNDSIPGAPGTA